MTLQLLHSSFYISSHHFSTSSTMRTPHSRSPAPVERLQAMDIRDNSPETGSENSYVQVDEHGKIFPHI